MCGEGIIKRIYNDNYFKIYISNTYQGDIPEKRNTYYRLKNIVYNLSSPFTMAQLVDEFGIGINQLRMYFPKLQAEGYIKLAVKDKFTYIYISSKYQSNTPMLTTDYHKIKRFVYYFGKPFTAKLIVKELGIQYHTVLSRLRKMYAESYIKFLGRDKWAKVCILNKNYGKET
jgi:hypothetical protein